MRKTAFIAVFALSLVCTLTLTACPDPVGDGDGDGDGAPPDGGVEDPDGGSSDSGANGDGDGDGDGEPRDGGTADVDAGGTLDAGIDLTEGLFDPDRLLVVDVTLPDADWTALKAQTRTLLDILAPGCLDQPFDSPFTWFEGDIVIDGEAVQSVGIRKKGFLGSLDPNRPSLKIKFDKYVDDQSYSGTTRLTLNNSRQDPSYVRQCLAYDVFRSAGLAAPRCNFAHVTVNGEDMGVFAHIEAIKKPMLRRHFDSDDGNLYEGTLSDFRPEWLNTFEQKTNEDMPSSATLQAIADAIAGPDEDLVAALSVHLDLDRFYRFWATEVLVGHWDGYAGNTNNFYVYDDPTSGKLHFLPWGTDGSFINPVLFFEGMPAPFSVFASGALARRLYLYPPTRDAYLATFTSLLDEVWDEAALNGEVDRMTLLFADALRPDETENHSNAVATTRAFIDGRRTAALDELTPYYEWSAPLRNGLCLAQSGSIVSTFDTTFGSHPAMDYFSTGTGTWSGTYLDVPMTATNVGSGAGLNPNVADGSRTQIILPAQTTEYGFVFVVVGVDTALLGDNVTLTIDGGAVDANFFRFTDGAVMSLGQVYEGSVVLSTGAPVADAPFAGAFVGSIVTF